MKEFFKISKAHIWTLSIYVVLTAILFLYGSHLNGGYFNWVIHILYWPIEFIAGPLWTKALFPLLNPQLYAASSSCKQGLECLRYLLVDLPPTWYAIVAFIVLGLPYVYILVSTIKVLSKRFKK